MQGQWVIIGSDLTRRAVRLLQNGDQSFSGRSVRKNFRKTQRVLLLDPLEEAALAGIDTDQLVMYQGQEYHVRVCAVVSPYSKRPVGAYGTYVRAEHTLPPEPIIGGLEWHIQGEREIYWDRNLASLYGMDPNTLHPVQGSDPTIFHPPQEWLTHWVDAAGQNRLHKLISIAASGAAAGTWVISYTISHPTTGKTRTLELAACNVRRDDGAMTFHGMSREVDEEKESDLPEELQDPPSRLDALVELTADIPLAKVKAQTGEPVQLFPGWRLSGLPNLWDNHLYDLIEPRKRAVLARIIGDGETGTTAQLIEGTHFRSAQCDWMPVDLWVKPIGDGDVMIRLKLR